ncbi:MAG TPA: flagellar hook-length control protein FliK, partial [Tepidisphaeraceae bacterium]|nr:flagellar hook-length control protein FliK [Tepidisphaeraceae bacterium]
AAATNAIGEPSVALTADAPAATDLSASPFGFDAAAPKEATAATAKPAAAAPPVPPEVRFAEANHAKIVAGVRGELLPNGGTMHLKLDPPQLGPMAVSVHLKDGLMTATFETTSDDATRLLSHSLAQLKTALEQQGVTVERLQVQQAPKDQKPDNQQPDQQRPGHRQQQDLGHDSAAHRERQRQELLRRMWSKLSGDPLDLVA